MGNNYIFKSIPLNGEGIIMMRRSFFVVLLMLGAAAALQALPEPVTGADNAADLLAPVFAGGGAFSTSLGGAAASAVNPAAGGGAQRIVFDFGYIALPSTTELGFGNAINLGALFPTKFAVFGGSLNFLHTPFDKDKFPSDINFGGNLNVAKELYPGLDIGLGFNFGFGDIKDNWTVSGDLGFRYNLGKLAALENFTLAFAMKGMGKSLYPTAFTPVLGVSTDFIHLKGNGDTADPLKLSGSLDLGFPGVYNMTGKIGASLVLAEIATISASWGFNVKEIIRGIPPTFPSIGVGFNFALKSGGERILGGRLPSDGDLTATVGVKPLYDGVIGAGAGLTWFVGVTDTTPPTVIVDYPEIQWISPNNDGLADFLEFPIKIQDQRYVTEWAFEIKDSQGETVRTYQNKELRPETQGINNVIVRLIMVKSGVEIPESLRWDGIFDNGDLAPDGSYFFTVSAADDNGNTITTEPYEVIVDNTPPAILIEVPAESDRIFSPDGDGNKDTLEIRQSGSWEEFWDAGVYNALGAKVKTFGLIEQEPGLLVWDGTGDDGAIVADGVYSYRISATDRALNTESAALDNIIVNTIQPTVSLLIADAYFSPNGDGIKDTITLSLGVPVREGIVGWEVRIQDIQGGVLRTLTGPGESPPARIDYDGKNDRGTTLAEGIYHGELAVRYRNGYVSTALSPVFTLDVTAPTATVRAEYTAFSPNNDGIQDEMIFLQEGSNEVLWQGEIRRSGAPASERAVRTVRGSGSPAARFVWDGFNDAGAIAPDGEYTYQLSATDQAGNSGRSNTIRFTLSTADTEALISTDYRAFSPNGNGTRDSISLIPQLQLNQGIASWRVDVLDAQGTAVRRFEGQGSVPANLAWNGRTTAGTTAPDGTYTASLELRYTMGNQPTAVSRPFVLDTTAPQAELSAPFTIFSPNGDGLRDFIPLNVVTQGNDEWEASISSVSSAGGTVVRTWTWTGAAPALSWDGTDQAGNSVPDGTYRLTLSSADEAGNSFRRTIDNIVVDARVPRVFLTASATGIAPGEGRNVRFGIILSIREGIDSWKFEIKDEAGRVIRTYPDTTNPAAIPPETISWNGMDTGGNVREGRYTPQLTVTYAKGDLVTSQTAPIIVDITGPVLSFRSQPEYFSPDNDGVDDDLIMFLGVQDVSPIANWSLEIREPEPPNLLFYRIEGRGSPAERTTWNGRSSRGELVQSATDYPFVFRAEDALGNASSLEGKIGVDVLVIRDGDRLKIQVPSIVFRANAADFNGLPQDVVDNNNRILRRIAEILNKFRDYQVQVEGHANPTTAPGTAARSAEETGSAREIGLQPLSEDRARATVGFLVGFGVNRGRLSSIGAGGTRPVVRFEDRDNWWKNRRVEFILIK
jgi:flagellar hook assembly protein FlgD/flagellar motor protein MotB